MDLGQLPRPGDSLRVSAANISVWLAFRFQPARRTTTRSQGPGSGECEVEHLPWSKGGTVAWLARIVTRVKMSCVGFWWQTRWRSEDACPLHKKTRNYRITPAFKLSAPHFPWLRLGSTRAEGPAASQGVCQVVEAQAWKLLARKKWAPCGAWLPMYVWPRPGQLRPWEFRCDARDDPPHCTSVHGSGPLCNSASSIVCVFISLCCLCCPFVRKSKT
jgi:hypothetical protein